MDEAKIYFEIDGLGIDKDGTPVPAYVCLTLNGHYTGEKPKNYDELAKLVNIEELLDLMRLSGVVSPDAVRILTPEEYMKKYGVRPIDLDSEGAE